MRKIVEPPPLSRCDYCGGALNLKEVGPAQSVLGLQRQVYVCGQCGRERTFVTTSEAYAPPARTSNEHGCS